MIFKYATATLCARQQQKTSLLKLRITYDRKSRYYKTGYTDTITPEEFRNKKLKKTKDAIDAATNDLNNAHLIIKELGSGFSFEKFEHSFRKLAQGIQYDPTKLRTLAEKYISENPLSASSISSYRTTINHAENMLPDIKVQDIDTAFVTSFIKKAKTKDLSLSENSLRIYLRNLRALYNYAIDKGYASGPNPFSKIKGQPLSSVKRQKAALTHEEMHSVLKSKAQGKNVTIAKDFFLLTFLLMGANLVDIMRLRNKDVTDGHLRFTRKKTRKTATEIEGDITDRALSILAKYGTLCPEKPDDYILPFLNNAPTEQQQRHRVGNLDKKINDGLKTICKEEGLRPVTLYYARHSFATYLRDNGYGIETIQRFLGHSSSKTTEIYLGSLTRDTISKEKQLMETMLDKMGF